MPFDAPPDLSFVPTPDADLEPHSDAPPLPPPRLPIRPERLAEEGGWRPDSLHLRRQGHQAFYLTAVPAQGPSQTLFLAREALARLVELAASPTLESGQLWAALANIPLERPLPSRRLDAELRALLTTFALELLR